MSFLRTLFRRLLTVAAVLIILVALAVGGLRLLTAQLPSHQAQLERWVGESLGLHFGFDAMDVRFGLRGPELTFHEVDVAAPDQTEPFLVARRAAVVLDPWSLLAERELRAKRLNFDGTSLTLVRRADGRFGLLGAPASGRTAADLALLMPPDIQVAVRNSRLVYVDPGPDLLWEFRNVTIDLERGGDGLELEVRAEPPAELGSRIEVAAQGALPGGPARDWRFFGDIRDVNLDVLAASLPDLAALPRRGGGDVALWLEWRDTALVRGMLDATLGDVAWTEDESVDPAYEHLAVSAEWQRSVGGWRVVLNDIDVRRDDRVWPAGADSVLELDRGTDGVDRLELTSGFLRLEDLSPLIAALPESSATLRWLELDPRGDVSDADLAVVRGTEGYEYAVAARFDRIALEATGRRPGFEGLSGEIRADTGGGRVSFDTRDAQLEWPQLLRSALDVGELSGVVVWREGFDAIRVVSDDLVLANRDTTTRSSLELTLPLDGSSPQLDVETSVGPFTAVAAKRYLPVHAMPATVVAWLDNALQGGEVLGGELAFVGPLDAFPFDGGEGMFRATAEVRDGVLEFVDGWPRAENLDGTIEFLNAGFAARGAGRVLGNESDDVRVGIDDLRNAVLSIRAQTNGPLADVLAFLNGSPLIARHLGPGYDRMRAPAGTGSVALDLALPLLDMPAYGLDAALEIADGELAIDGFAPRATAIAGTLRFADGAVSGDGIEAVLLDGPVTARVSPAEVDGYRARLEIEGEVTADAAAAAFELPLADLVAGQTRWRAEVLIPSQSGERAPVRPLEIGIGSNLSGVALRLPEPFAKAAGDATNLRLDFTVGAERMDVEGHVGPTRRFALRFAGGDTGLALERGTLRLGGGLPELRASSGLTVYGAVPALHFDDWAAMVRAGRESEQGAALADSGLGELFNEAELDVADFSVFGQQLGASRLSVRRGVNEWLIDVDSAPVAGTIAIPRDLRGRPPIVAEMGRLYLEPGGGAGGGNVDPRELLGLRLSVDDFAFGQRRLGSLEADVRSDPVGLRLVSFESSSDVFTASGSGGWFDGPEGPATRLAFHLTATDVAATLSELALDPIASGETAEITGSVYWPGSPSGDWTQHLGGDLSLRLGPGSLLDIDPGAGRVVGLMSISALPRRLALDFRDVFNKGLVFDELTGDFTIIDGNAFTDNLKVTGPVAEIGVAGRIGLRDRDYRQQVVVAAEPGKMLPTVGGLIGGPGVGAALLIFTRIFKEPLKGIGRASYCVTGTWEEPLVERLTPAELEEGQLCAELPPAAAAP